MPIPETNLPTIREVAAEAGVSHWTVRRYIVRGVIEVFRDQRGWIRCQPNAADKVRAHFQAHGAPGGRPLPQ